MSAGIKAAMPADLPPMVELLMQDAQSRQAHDQKLWALAEDARDKVEEAVTFALTGEKQPYRQRWLVAEAGDKLVGIVHSVLLPAPICAGKWGDAGLLMPECFVARDAPPGTIEALVDAAEADIREARAHLSKNQSEARRSERCGCAPGRPRRPSR